MTFHIEHIIARQHGGGDDLSNLALACHHCNLHKGPNLSGIDPVTSRIVPLFNPRTQQWRPHFHLEDGVITGLTSPTGRRCGCWGRTRRIASNSAGRRWVETFLPQ